MFWESLSWMFGPLTLVFGLSKIRLSAVKIEPWSKWRRALKQPRRLGYEDATVWSLMVPGWRCLIFQFLSQGCAPRRGLQSITSLPTNSVQPFQPAVRRRLPAVPTLGDTVLGNDVSQVFFKRSVCKSQPGDVDRSKHPFSARTVWGGTLVRYWNRRTTSKLVAFHAQTNLCLTLLVRKGILCTIDTQ